MSCLRIVRAAGVLLFGLVLALVVVVPPRAAAAGAIDPAARATLVIHKYEQPDALGESSDGLPLDQPSVDGLTPVAGVRFRVSRVPGVDLTTGEGQRAAAELTAAEASARVAGASGRTGVTGADGRLDVASLEVGLYYVEEISAPVGVVPAAPFLVALPLSDPHTGAGWLYTVHVYPKNPRAGVGLNVSEAITCVDEVSWTSRTAIPRQQTLDQYLVRHLLPPGVRVAGGEAGVRIALGGAELGPADALAGLTTVAGRETVEVSFTTSGRAALVAARAADPGAQVIITFGTLLPGWGIHAVDVELLIDDAAPIPGSAATSFVGCTPTPSPTPGATPGPAPDPGTSGRPGDRLAVTGSQVSGLALLGLALIGCGIVLVRRSRRERGQE
ncbi:MAG: SpaH/EbpB family LPXTG-anchored major pilin [Propioniciclava sp.]|uniref:SpaH/EbpB family LPXTG-anchored major pilin n=1 Tax=Propioniciclava sp. TaxID=2038686 RepID=UPI0039E58235